MKHEFVEMGSILGIELTRHSGHLSQQLGTLRWGKIIIVSFAFTSPSNLI